jgi:hypothetical protein
MRLQALIQRKGAIDAQESNVRLQDRFYPAEGAMTIAIPPSNFMWPPFDAWRSIAFAADVALASFADSAGLAARQRDRLRALLRSAARAHRCLAVTRGRRRVSPRHGRLTHRFQAMRSVDGPRGRVA